MKPGDKQATLNTYINNKTTPNGYIVNQYGVLVFENFIREHKKSILTFSINNCLILMGDYKRTVKRIQQNITKELPGLTAQLKMAPLLSDGAEFPLTPSKTAKQSAVLIGIYPKNHNAHTILIKRAVYDGVHSGQVSFPGGKYEDQDSDLVETALREAQEEVGITPQNVEIIGRLTPLFISVSNMLVLPVVGLMPEPKNLLLNLQEVEYTISPSLMHLKSKACLSVKTINSLNRLITAPYFDAENEMIWGATAMIISELTELY
ncbi:MAG: CoA pyrophosphatase [Bacteroidales bacterium]|nr:CoA pyrophosphatase [Bacteroidales bacterium]MDD3891330.1 CoA pyrophosphatase [Bacteroidales bacterium]